jgi:hypothetical protein
VKLKIKRQRGNGWNKEKKERSFDGQRENRANF